MERGEFLDRPKALELLASQLFGNGLFRFVVICLPLAALDCGLMRLGHHLFLTLLLFGIIFMQVHNILRQRRRLLLVRELPLTLLSILTLCLTIIFDVLSIVIFFVPLTTLLLLLLPKLGDVYRLLHVVLNAQMSVDFHAILKGLNRVVEIRVGERMRLQTG